MNRFFEGQGAFSVQRSLCVGHLACIHRSERAGDGLLIGEELVEGGWGYASFRSYRICRGLVITQPAKHRSCGTEQILLPLLAACVMFTIWIEDGHTQFSQN